MAGRRYGIVMPTRSRYDSLEKVLPHWMEQDLPITLIVEPNELAEHKRFLRDHDFSALVAAESQRRSNAGIGWARDIALNVAHRAGYHSVIMADDDVYPRKGDDVRTLLKFTSAEKSLGIAGWMPNYGLWIPNGNAIAKEDDLVVAMTGGPDRIFSLNVAEAIAAGGFNRKLDIRYENSEINRCGIRAGYLWYVCSAVHIKMINRPYDPGGLVALAGSEEQRRAREKACHAVIYDVWGGDYISHPDKRYACRWKKMIGDFIGQKAIDVLWSHEPRHIREVKASGRDLL